MNNALIFLDTIAPNFYRFGILQSYPTPSENNKTVGACILLKEIPLKCLKWLR